MLKHDQTWQKEYNQRSSVLSVSPSVCLYDRSVIWYYERSKCQLNIVSQVRIRPRGCYLIIPLEICLWRKDKWKCGDNRFYQSKRSAKLSSWIWLWCWIKDRIKIEENSTSCNWQSVQKKSGNLVSSCSSKQIDIINILSTLQSITKLKSEIYEATTKKKNTDWSHYIEDTKNDFSSQTKTKL